MAINLHDLKQAADRYHAHRVATEGADSETTLREKAIVSERHRKLFIPPSERLKQIKASPIAIAVAATTDLVGSLAPPAPTLMIIEGDVIPEVLQRDNDLRPVRFLQLAMLVARSIGRNRISHGPVTDEGDATGFMIAPGLLMTNWHVLKTEEFAGASKPFTAFDLTNRGSIATGPLKSFPRVAMATLGFHTAVALTRVGLFHSHYPSTQAHE